MPVKEAVATEAVTRDDIRGYVDGDISGQVAVGKGNIQVGSVHGGVVNIVAGEQPVPRLRPPPVRRGVRPLTEDVLGRETELEKALAALRRHRPVELHGAPGVGKTMLLMHLAGDPSLPVPDRVVYKRARRVPVADLLQQLFDTFYEADVRFKPTEGQIREYLDSIEAVVILDDTDLDRDDVEELFGSAPGCLFLVASTERRLWGTATTLSLGGLPDEAGVALIERELGRTLGDDERAAALALHRALNGHPLRLVQAASLVTDGQSLAEQAAEFAAADASGALPAPVRATLDAHQLDVLALLAAHGDAPLPVDHIVDLTGRPDTAAVLQSLLVRQLVQAHSPRYSLTVPLSAEEDRALGVDSWADRAVDHWTSWAARHSGDPEEIVDDLEPMLGAIDQAKAKGRWEDTVRLVRAIDPAVVLSRQWGRWKGLLSAALNAARKAGDRTGEAWSLHQLGVRALCLGDDRDARSLLQQSLGIRKALGDTAGSDVTQYHLDLLRPPPVPQSGGGRRPPAGPLLGLLLLPLLGFTLFPLLLGDDGKATEDLSIDVRPGRLLFDRASAVRVVSVRNNGDRPVKVHQLSIDGAGSQEFTVIGESCSKEALASQSSCSVAVRFLSAATAAAPPARLLIANSAGQPAAVSLATLGGELPPTTSTTTLPATTSTTRVTPPAPGLIMAEPLALQFGSRPLGRPGAPLLVTVRSTGLGPVGLSRVAVAGRDAADFSVVDDRCTAATLGPLGTCTIGVRFAPTEPGSRAAVLTVDAAGPGSALQVPLAGSGAGGGGPHLVSVAGDDLTGTVTYRFDAGLAAAPLDRAGFHLYAGTGPQFTPASVTVVGSTVLARFTAAQVARSTVATVEEGAVADNRSRVNEVCDAPLHDVVPVPGATTAPDLVGIRLGPGASGLQVLFFDFEQRVQLGVAPGSPFQVIDATNNAYEAVATVSAGAMTIGASFEMPGQPVVRGVVETGAVVAAGGGAPVPNPLQSAGIGGPGTANVTTGPDLTAVDVVGAQTVRYTFDQAVVAPGASAFRVYGPDAVEQSGAGVVPVAGRPEAVDVSFSPGGPVPVDTAVGASLAEGGVPGEPIGTLLMYYMTPPPPMPQPGKASLPLRGRSFSAGRTDLPDLVAVARTRSAGRPAVSFTFDEPLPSAYQTAPTTRLRLSLYQADGSRAEATGPAVVTDSGRRVVLSADNFGGAAVLSGAVTGSVDDAAASEPEVREACRPLS